MIKNKRNSGLDAYLSLEASLVIPFVLLLIFTLVMLALFSYGRAGLNADAYLLLFRESVRKDDADIAADIGNGYAGQAAERYPGLSKPEFRVSGNDRKLVLDAAADSAGYGFSVKQTAYRYDPAGDVRRYRRLLHIGRKIKSRVSGDG